MSVQAPSTHVGWVERERYPTDKPESWVSFLNPTYKVDILKTSPPASLLPQLPQLSGLTFQDNVNIRVSGLGLGKLGLVKDPYFMDFFSNPDRKNPEIHIT